MALLSPVNSPSWVSIVSPSSLWSKFWSITLVKAYWMHLKENVALLQTKGLVFMIYSMEVCAAWYHPQKWQIRQREWTYLDAGPVCSARTLQIPSDRHTTQNSLRKNGIIKTQRNLVKNGSIKPRKRQERRWASGTVKPRFRHTTILLPFPVAFVCSFPYSSLSLQMGFGYTAKNMAPDNSWVFYLWCQSS